MIEWSQAGGPALRYRKEAPEMADYLITAEYVAELQSAVGTLIREAQESGLADYSNKLRVLLVQLTARPVAESPDAPQAELSAGWEVTVSSEAADGSFPFVTDRALVVGAVADMFGADLADSSVTIEQLDRLVEEVYSDYGVYLVPLAPEHLEQVAAGNTTFPVNHPVSGLMYVEVEQI